MPKPPSPRQRDHTKKVTAGDAQRRGGRSAFITPAKGVAEEHDSGASWRRQDQEQAEPRQVIDDTCCSSALHIRRASRHRAPALSIENILHLTLDVVLDEAVRERPENLAVLIPFALNIARAQRETKRRLRKSSNVRLER
jgi:hypothetical protein